MSLQLSAASTWIVIPAQEWPSLYKTASDMSHPADIWIGEALDKPLTVADIKALHHFAGQTPVGERKIAVLGAADQLRPEAANALLKLLEEPPAYLFLILVSESHRILPTLQSRVQRVKPGIVSSVPGSGERSTFSSWQDFLSQLPLIHTGARGQAKRMLYYQPLLHSTVQQAVVLEGFRNSSPS